MPECCKPLRSMKKPRVNAKQLKIYFALFMSMFTSSYSITMLFPFLPFMVQFLLPDIDASSIGTYAGMIASAAYLGRFLGSYIWGALSDSFGYKPILIISSLLLGLMSVLFGLSVNFPMAVAARFFLGLVNGIVGNAKAAMSANCDNSNQALGLSILASAHGVGLVIGPAISGAIADPIGQYNWNITDSVTRTFFTKFPYSLPCFVHTLFCMLSVLFVFILLPKQPRKNKPPSPANSPDSNDDIELTNISLEDSVNDDNDRLLPAEDLNGETAVDSTDSIDSTPKNGNVPTTNTQSRRKSSFVLNLIEGRRSSATLQYVKLRRWSINGSGERTVVEGDDEDTEQLNRTSSRCSRDWWIKKMKNAKMSILKSLKNLKLFFRDPVTRMTLIVYCTFSFAVIGFDEVYSLWCATPDYLGGLGFTLNEIGLSLSVVGVILLPFSLTIYPILDRMMGTLKTFIFGLGCVVFLVILMPNIHLILPLDLPGLLWVCLCVTMVVIRVVFGLGFSGSSLLINNSVTSDKLGSVNGLALMLTSGVRFFSPLFAGSIYSASLSDYNQSIGFPIDYHLIFIIFGLIFLLTLLMITSLPQSINRQKVVVVEEVEQTSV